jgi:hypothetical protein
VQPLPPAELLQMMETRARPIGFSLWNTRGFCLEICHNSRSLWASIAQE